MTTATARVATGAAPTTGPQLAAVRIIGPAGDAASAALAATREVFPEALVTRMGRLSDLGEALATGPELLVLLHPEPSELDHAAQATDARGGPRWAVVACSARESAGDTHLVHVAPADWTGSALRLVFPVALRLQAMQALHARLHGDLRTISRRLGHDLRGPLNSISTTSEAMLDPDEDPASPRAEFARSIAASVDELVRLFDRMSFTLKATTQPLPPQTVVMEELVWGASVRLESRIAQLGATVTKPEKWPVIEAVPAWLDVIWSNLLVNALEHGGPRPQIELGWEQLPTGYRFWVRDQGPGVPPQKEALLFHPLDRLSDLNAPRGYGLPIVRRLVELQGGYCGYERGIVRGGTFYFTLPSSA